LSGHLNGGLSNIILECTVAVKSIVRNHAPRDIIFWGESLGAFVQAHVFPHVRDNVSALFQCNGMSSLTSTIAQHVPFVFHALLLPMLGAFKDTASVFRHSLDEKKHRLFLFHADCDHVISDMQSKELYIGLKASFPDAVRFIQIRGKHNMVLLCSENQDTILDTVKKAHIIPSPSEVASPSPTG
jgi:predicted esterase